MDVARTAHLSRSGRDDFCIAVANDSYSSSSTSIKDRAAVSEINVAANCMIYQVGASNQRPMEQGGLDLTSRG